MLYGTYNCREENGRYVLYYGDEVFKTKSGKTVTVTSKGGRASKHKPAWYSK